ncbi:MAG: hypothetical protein E3K40_04780 [Candidatus Brocadia sp.]|nr:hypothetical protein [Candidatus Brocadia sp.]
MDNLTFTFLVLGVILIIGFGILYYQERKKHTH